MTISDGYSMRTVPQCTDDILNKYTDVNNWMENLLLCKI